MARKPLFTQKRSVLWALGGAPWSPGKRIHRRPWIGGSPGATPGPTVLFRAPFIDSLIPAVAVDNAYTFIRGTNATFIDHDGKITENKFVSASEARFSGARKVTNLDGESNQTTSWANTGSGTHTVNQAATFQGRDCISVTYPAGESGFAVTRADTNSSPAQIVVDVANSEEFVWAASVALSRALVGSESIRVYYSGFGALNFFDLNASNSAQFVNTFKRISAIPKAFPGFSGNKTFGFYTFIPAAPLSTPCTLYIADRQFEIVTGQSNQVIGEYVSNGYSVEHGSGQDGTKYFDTENGNSLISGIVNEGAGGALSAIDGLILEEQRTNLQHFSENIDPANSGWNASGTVGITPLSTAGPTGRITASNLVSNAAADAAIGVNYNYLPNTYYALSVFLANGTDGAITRFGMYQTGTPAWEMYAEVTWSGGVPTITANAGSATNRYQFLEGPNLNGFYRLVVGGRTSAGVSGTTTLEIQPDRNGTGNVDADCAQAEIGEFASTYIPTYGAANATRNNEGLIYSINNVNSTDGTLGLTLKAFADSSYYAPTVSRPAVGFAFSNADVLYCSNGQFRSYDGTLTTPVLPAFNRSDVLKMGVRWDSDNLTMNVRQDANQQDRAFDGSYGITALTFGYAGPNRFPAAYKDAIVYDGPLSDTAFTGLTT